MSFIQKSAVEGRQENGDYVPIDASEDGHLRVELMGPMSAMRRVLISEPTPLTQLDFTYGLPTGAFIGTNTAGTGTIVGQRGYAEISNGGGNIGAYASMYSVRVLRNRDGQGMEAYFVAKFDTPLNNVVQLAGAFTAEDGFAIGYGFEDDGTTPSTEAVLFVKSGGIRQVETLTLSGPSGVGTVDITLGGVTTQVALTSSTLEQNAWEIGEVAFPGWKAYSLGLTVVFIRDSVGPVAGGSYGTASGSPCSGSFATTTAGNVGVDTWIERSTWNGDKMDGTGPSGKTMNLQNWNVYRLAFTDTECTWYILDVEGHWNRLNTARSTSELLVRNSALPLQAVCYNVAGSLSQKTVRIAGMAGFISGPLVIRGARRGRSASVLGLTTTLRPISSYRLAPVYAGPNSQSPTAFSGLVWFPLLTVVNDGGRGLIVELVTNANLVNPQWSTVAGANASAVNRDTNSSAFSTPGEAGGTTIAAFAVAKGQSLTFDLKDLFLLLNVDQTLTFAAKSLATTTDIIVAPSWIEER